MRISKCNLLRLHDMIIATNNLIAQYFYITILNAIVVSGGVLLKLTKLNFNYNTGLFDNIVIVM